MSEVIQPSPAKKVRFSMLNRRPQQSENRSIMRRLMGVSHGKRSSHGLLTIHQIATIPMLSVWLLGGCFSVMLYYASRYQINVAYALAFFGFVAIGTSAWMSFRVLHGLVLTAAPHTNPCHAGELMQFEFVIEERQGRRRKNIIVHAGLKQYEVAIEPRGKVTVAFSAPANSRGTLIAPMVKISTPHPIGIWNTHHLWSPAQTGIVFPALEKNAPAMVGMQEDENDSASSAKIGNDGDSLVTIRNYQTGDQMRRIAWRLFAKSDGQILSTKQSEVGGSAMKDLWIEEGAVSNLSSQEQRLSRLSAWLIQAHDSGRSYGLRAGGACLDPGNSKAHRIQCMTSLAMSAGHSNRVAFDSPVTSGQKTKRWWK